MIAEGFRELQASIDWIVIQEIMSNTSVGLDIVEATSMHVGFDRYDTGRGGRRDAVVWDLGAEIKVVDPPVTAATHQLVKRLREAIIADTMCSKAIYRFDIHIPNVLQSVTTKSGEGTARAMAGQVDFTGVGKWTDMVAELLVKCVEGEVKAAVDADASAQEVGVSRNWQLRFVPNQSRNPS